MDYLGGTVIDVVDYKTVILKVNYKAVHNVRNYNEHEHVFIVNNSLFPGAYIQGKPTREFLRAYLLNKSVRVIVHGKTYEDNVMGYLIIPVKEEQSYALDYNE